ncbi:MAG: hypothetical protein OXN89_15265 [Bryobacterales bacterium]|nr:hypothetical protein [Bryobacterales bacterium]
MTDVQGRRRAALTLVSAFVAGGLAGAGVSWWRVLAGGRGRRLSPAEYRQWLLQDLGRRLDLDGEQREQIEAILDRYEERFVAVREAMEPEFEAIRADRADRIMSVLRPDQRAEYEAILEERRSHRRDGRWRGSSRGH